MAGIKLNEDQKTEFAKLYSKYPEFSDAIDTVIVEMGIEAFDPYEHTPLDLDAEKDAFSEGFSESATLGFSEGQEVERAGDVEVPYFGEVQPSRIAGNIAGGLIPGLGAYGLAGKAARGMGMVKGGIAVGVPDKARKLSMGGKVFQVVSAESVPGALQGWIQSDGDIDEVIKMAAIWTSAGLLLEGTGALAMRGWKKIRDGKKLTADEQSAVNETGRVFKEQAEEGGIPTDRDTKQQEVDNGGTFRSIVSRLPGLSRWADTISGETVGRAIVSDEARAAILFAFKQGFLPDGSRTSPVIARDQKSPIWDTIHENVDNVKQVDAIRNGLEVIEKAYETNDLTSPIQGIELFDMYLHGQLTIKDLNQLVRQDIPAAQADLGATPGGSAGAQKVTWSLSQLEETISSIHKKAFRSDKGAMRGPGGRFEKRVLDEPATQDQTVRLSELVTKINDTLERIDEPMISSKAMNKVLDSRNSMNKARQMETFLRSQIYKIDLKAREKAHSTILREDINPERIQEIEIENATKGWKAAFARTRGYQSEKSFKENIKEIREALVKKRTRFKVDPEGKFWDPGDPKAYRREGVGYVKDPKADPQTDIFKDLGLPWFLKVVPPYARWGLGSHPLTKQGVEYGMNMFEEIGKLKMDYIKRYQQAVAPLNAGNKKELLASLGRQGAKEAVEEEIRKKNLLVQALNGENVNEILKQNRDLVPIYNQIRGLLDEAGDHIGLGFDKSGYLKDYFPHIFDGTTGVYRARRLSMEIGKRIGKVTKFLDDRTVDSIPALKHFASKKAREANAEGYNMDLDAVMYTYLSGAAEMPFFNKFLDMSQSVIGRLPKKGVDGKNMALRGQYANWVNYVVGRPSEWKDTWANWWKNNDLFNRNVDHMVELLGDAETKGLMTILRGQTIGKGEAREGGFTFSKAQEDEAIRWFDNLIKDADKQTADGKLKGMSVKQWRARAALKIDDIRAGLSNPHARPVVLESMYRSLVVAKLGLSISHGVINLTQTLVDAMPLLGVKGVARGVSRYVGNKQAKFDSGVTVEDVLNESGILSDIPEAREFTPNAGLGVLSDLEEIAMAPARISENFNRGVAFLGKYEKSIADGMDHPAAVIDARRFVQKVHFPFNRAGTIPLFHSPGARFLLMFKSYALHQMNFSAELLENAIVDGDVGPLAKHLLAYAALGSAASLAAGGGASNLPLQVGHPLEDFTPTNLANRGVLKTVGGPPADMILDILHGNYMSAIESYDYTAFKRIREASMEEEAPKAVLTGLGFR